MNKKGALKAILLLVLVISLIGIFASSVSAGPLDSINSFFSQGKYQNYSKMIDFFLFFTLFFAAAFLAFSKWFGGGFGNAGSAKGAVIGLSFAIGCLLSFAIVTVTNFSVTNLFPIAKNFMLVIFWLVLYGILSNDALIGGESWTSKIVAGVLAGILAFVLFNIAINYVCLMEPNRNDPQCMEGLVPGMRGLAKWINPSWFDGSSSGSGDSGSGTSGGASGAGLGGTGSDDGKGSGGTTPVKKGICRLDGNFKYDTIDFVTKGNIADFSRRVKAAGINQVYVYGFASKEGGESHNAGLSTRRAKTVESEINSVGVGLSVSVSGEGETDLFDGTYPPNRRFIISTQSLGVFTPAPSLGSSIFDCEKEVPPVPVCKVDKDCKAGEKCDDGKCIPMPIPPPVCTKDSECKAGEKCVNGACVIPTPPKKTCLDDSDCASGEECVDGSCIASNNSGSSLPWWAWALIIGGILLLVLGGAFGFRKFTDRNRTLNTELDQIRRLLLLAQKKIHVLSHTMHNLPRGYLASPAYNQEMAKLKKALQTKSITGMKRAVKKLFDDASFIPGLTGADRVRLRDDFIETGYVLRKAERLVNEKFYHLFHSRYNRATRLINRLEKLTVSPIVNPDGSVLFIYHNDSTDVLSAKVQIRTPGAVSPTTHDLVAKHNHIWDFQTPAGQPDGQYHYRYAITYRNPAGNLTRLESDELHGYKDASGQWSTFTK